MSDMSSADGNIFGRGMAAVIQAVFVARSTRNDGSPCHIEEGLYLGSVGAALNKEALKELNITHILTVAKSLDPAFPNDFVYKKIEVLDTPDTKLEDYFDECFNFIDEARGQGGGVLVHCFAGRSRSVTIVAAYLMKKHQMTLLDALSLIRTTRPCAAPNLGFLSQLRKFERSLTGGFSVDSWVAPLVGSICTTATCSESRCRFFMIQSTSDATDQDTAFIRPLLHVNFLLQLRGGPLTIQYRSYSVNYSYIQAL